MKQNHDNIFKSKQFGRLSKKMIWKAFQRPKDKQVNGMNGKDKTVRGLIQKVQHPTNSSFRNREE